jgi:hypothetical protein
MAVADTLDGTRRKEGGDHTLCEAVAAYKNGTADRRTVQLLLALGVVSCGAVILCQAHHKSHQETILQRVPFVARGEPSAVIFYTLKCHGMLRIKTTAF